MNINETLIKELDDIGPPSVDYLRNYDCDKYAIKDYLLATRSHTDRQNLAIDIIERIF